MSESVGWFGKIREKERVRLLISKSCQHEVWWLVLQPIWPSPWEGWLHGDRRCLLEGVFFLDKYPPWAPRPPSSTILRTWARVREAFTAFKCENRGERSRVTVISCGQRVTPQRGLPRAVSIQKALLGKPFKFSTSSTSRSIGEITPPPSSKAQGPSQWVCVCVCVSLSRVQLVVTLWTVAHQASLSVEFSRQAY